MFQDKVFAPKHQHDEYCIYNFIAGGYSHRTVKHGAKEYVRYEERWCLGPCNAIEGILSGLHNFWDRY